MRLHVPYCPDFKKLWSEVLKGMRLHVPYCATTTRRMLQTSISEYFRAKQQMCTFEAPDFAHIFDVVTKIFRAQIFTTTTTTKAKLILNKLSEVHTY